MAQCSNSNNKKKNKSNLIMAVYFTVKIKLFPSFCVLLLNHETLCMFINLIELPLLHYKSKLRNALCSLILKPSALQRYIERVNKAAGNPTLSLHQKITVCSCYWTAAKTHHLRLLSVAFLLLLLPFFFATHAPMGMTCT